MGLRPLREGIHALCNVYSGKEGQCDVDSVNKKACQTRYSLFVSLSWLVNWLFGLVVGWLVCLIKCLFGSSN